jgi:hypothetical protein
MCQATLSVVIYRDVIMVAVFSIEPYLYLKSLN